VFVTITTNGVPPDLERKTVQNLLWMRLRSEGPNPPVHLGEIKV
jgi:hypothetical protein